MRSDLRYCARRSRVRVIPMNFPLPDNAELFFLRDVLLAHALGRDARRQREALTYIFKEQIEKRENCPKIDAETLFKVAAPSGAKIAKSAAHGLVRDIKR